MHFISKYFQALQIDEDLKNQTLNDLRKKWKCQFLMTIMECTNKYMNISNFFCTVAQTLDVNPEIVQEFAHLFKSFFYFCHVMLQEKIVIHPKLLNECFLQNVLRLFQYFDYKKWCSPTCQDYLEIMPYMDLSPYFTSNSLQCVEPIYISIITTTFFHTLYSNFHIFVSNYKLRIVNTMAPSSTSSLCCRCCSTLKQLYFYLYTSKTLGSADATEHLQQFLQDQMKYDLLERSHYQFCDFDACVVWKGPSKHEWRHFVLRMIHNEKKVWNPSTTVSSAPNYTTHSMAIILVNLCRVYLSNFYNSKLSEYRVVLPRSNIKCYIGLRLNHQQLFSICIQDHDFFVINACVLRAAISHVLNTILWRGVYNLYFRGLNLLHFLRSFAVQENLDEVSKVLRTCDSSNYISRVLSVFYDKDVFTRVFNMSTFPVFDDHRDLTVQQFYISIHNEMKKRMGVLSKLPLCWRRVMQEISINYSSSCSLNNSCECTVECVMSLLTSMFWYATVSLSLPFNLYESDLYFPFMDTNLNMEVYSKKLVMLFLKPLHHYHQVQTSTSKKN